MYGNTPTWQVRHVLSYVTVLPRLPASFRGLARRQAEQLGHAARDGRRGLRGVHQRASTEEEEEPRVPAADAGAARVHFATVQNGPCTLSRTTAIYCHEVELGNTPMLH